MANMFEDILSARLTKEESIRRRGQERRAREAASLERVEAATSRYHDLVLEVLTHLGAAVGEDWQAPSRCGECAATWHMDRHLTVELCLDAEQKPSHFTCRLHTQESPRPFGRVGAAIAALAQFEEKVTVTHSRRAGLSQAELVRALRELLDGKCDECGKRSFGLMVAAAVLVIPVCYALWGLFSDGFR